MGAFLTSPIALLVLAPLVLARDAVEVRVVRADGSPGADLAITAQVGLARFALAEDFERWLSVKELEARTGADGRARFDALPPSARVTVYTRGEREAALAEGSAESEIVLTLQPTGTLAGKVTSKKSLQGWSVRAVGPRGFDDRKVELGSGGEWELRDLPSGEIDLELRLGNWTALRKTVEVKPEKSTKVPALKPGEEFLTGADPLVDVRKVRLVGKDKKPMAGTQFCWSSPWMDGGMATDEEGEVLLDGGGVAIGPPPFVLRLAYVGGGFGDDPGFLGKLVGVQRGTAVIEASLVLDPLLLTVTRAGSRLDPFQALAVTGGDEPRVWQAKLENGVLRFLVPPGPVRLVVGTADGRICEATLDKEPGTVEHTVALAD
jgi:hypothetical protein